jgi:hypothetical protein
MAGRGADARRCCRDRRGADNRLKNSSLSQIGDSFATFFDASHGATHAGVT